MTDKPSYVYLLVSSNNNTYVGATVDVDHRLRQHNGEIKGGAWATTNKVKQGEKWTRACYVSGFPDWRSALQFEWKWKYLSRQLPKNMLPLERRIQALQQLLSLERATSSAIPFLEWETKPEVHIEIEEVYQYYK